MSSLPLCLVVLWGRFERVKEGGIKMMGKTRKNLYQYLTSFLDIIGDLLDYHHDNQFDRHFLVLLCAAVRIVGNGPSTSRSGCCYL